MSSGARSMTSALWRPPDFPAAVLGRGYSCFLRLMNRPRYLVRLGAHAVTHLTGTPSTGARADESSAHAIRPRYVRLSGEIADQAILKMLRVSTRRRHRSCLCVDRSGVGFEVNDGLEGFPASLVGAPETST